MDAVVSITQRTRDLMVDGQVRPSKVNDFRLIDAMRRLPRERFVPPEHEALAYADVMVPLGPPGRFLLSPVSIARLVQMVVQTVPPGRVLVAAAGTGYGATLLAICGYVVIALEEDAGLAAWARQAVHHTGVGTSGVTVIEGPLARGYPDTAPYDAILIEGAVRRMPHWPAAQLRPESGRLVAVVTDAAHPQASQAAIGEVTAAGIRTQPMFDCTAPLLAAFAPGPGFVF